MAEIKLNIELDEQNVPARISWEASDRPADFNPDTKCFNLSLWDEKNSSIMKLDLWTNEMKVGEMKRFIIQSIGGLGETLINATQDEQMFQEVTDLCNRLAEILKVQEQQSV